MNAVLYPIWSAAYLAVLIWGVAIRRRSVEPGFRYLLLPVTAALLWDNFILSAGAWTAASESFERLHLTRYWLHAAVTPLLVLVAYDLIRLTGAAWVRRPAAAAAAWLLTAGLIVWEGYAVVLRLDLTPVFEHGIVTYEPVRRSPAGAVMIAAVMLALLLAAIILQRRTGSRTLLAGTLLMLLGAAAGPLTGGISSVANLFELILTLALWLTIRRFELQARTIVRMRSGIRTVPGGDDGSAERSAPSARRHE